MMNKKAEKKHNDVKQIIEYVVNPDKTDEGIFVTYGFMHNGTEDASKAFELSNSYTIQLMVAV